MLESGDAESPMSPTAGEILGHWALSGLQCRGKGVEICMFCAECFTCIHVSFIFSFSNIHTCIYYIYIFLLNFLGIQLNTIE